MIHCFIFGLRGVLALYYVTTLSVTALDHKPYSFLELSLFLWDYRL
jgi:hypothetical protein